MQDINLKNSPDASWRVSDILGFEVFTQDGECLGVLADVIPTAGNDVWVVRFDGEEILIPALKTIVKEVNLLRKKIFVVLPQGYKTIYGSVKSADGDVCYDGYVVYED